MKTETPITTHQGMLELDGYLKNLAAFKERYVFWSTQITQMQNNVTGLTISVEKLKQKKAELEAALQTRMGMAESEIKALKGQLAAEIQKAEAATRKAVADQKAAERERQGARAILEEAEGIRKQQLVVEDIKQKKVTTKK